MHNVYKGLDSEVTMREKTSSQGDQTHQSLANYSLSIEIAI